MGVGGREHDLGQPLNVQIWVSGTSRPWGLAWPWLGLPMNGLHVELCGHNLVGPTVQADMKETAP